MLTIQEQLASILPQLQPHVPGGAAPLAERVLAALWPFVVQALEGQEGVSEPITAPRDKRTKPWQYTVRFWATTPNGEELQGETDPAVIDSTGKLPDVVSALAVQLHGEATPRELSPASLKERLPQLRNNLGRAGSGVWRILYYIEDTQHMCQVDVVRLES